MLSRPDAVPTDGKEERTHAPSIASLRITFFFEDFPVDDQSQGRFINRGCKQHANISSVALHVCLIPSQVFSKTSNGA